MTSKSVERFRARVWNYSKQHGRHDLPWRKTTDPYRILVSEVMLQQTQVPRVIGKYKEFLKAFPTVRALAKAPLSDVLTVWSGLGYNRRAKYLHEAAKAIALRHNGRIPREYAALRMLPGVGEYTARAIRVFAFNEQDVLLETNIRSAFIHHFFQDIPLVHDRQVRQYAQIAARGQDSREWHAALMDYGAYLKRRGVRNNHKNVQYVKQARFEGSLRQVRGAVLTALVRGGRVPASPRNKRALVGLARDGLIARARGGWRIAA